MRSKRSVRALGLNSVAECAAVKCTAHVNSPSCSHHQLTSCVNPYGTMGTASYVVSGLGNPLSLNSSPHGAGREYSRSAARRTFTHEQLREAMQGIEFRDTDAFIDEIPQAYKPIDRVMADAADLVEVRHTLRQLVNVKGD